MATGPAPVVPDTSSDARAAVYTAHLQQCFARAEAGQSKITPEVASLEGMSGLKTRHFYNNLLELPGARYLEVGTWTGSSTCAAMCGNAAERVLAIDNWSQFGGPKQEFERNFAAHVGANAHATFLEADAWQLDASTLLLPEPQLPLAGPQDKGTLAPAPADVAAALAEQQEPAQGARAQARGQAPAFPLAPDLPPQPLLHGFNVYLYDGCHAATSHFKALSHFLPCLDDVFIYVVDDWNWPQVRSGTLAALSLLKLRVLWRHEIRLTQDDSHTPLDIARESWWNGIAAFVLAKPATVLAPQQAGTIHAEGPELQ